MSIRMKPDRSAAMAALAALAMGNATLYAPAALAEESPEPPRAEDAATADSTDSGLSGNLYFTDENGNPRNPTAAELIAAGESFEKDLARLAGKHKGKLNVRTEPSGAVAATVATSQLVFLTATVNEDGTVTLGHSAVDADGNVVAQPVNDLPEM